VETAAAVEIEKGCLRRFSLEDFHRCLKKSSQKPLRLFHSYHRPDGGDYDNKVNFSETAIHLKVASFWSEEWGAPHFRFACQGFKRPLFELIIVLFLADVGVVDATPQHSVDEDRQFVCGGDDSLRFTDAGTKTATKSAKRALAAKQALGAQAKNGSSAVDRLTGTAFQHTAAGDLVVGDTG